MRDVHAEVRHDKFSGRGRRTTFFQGITLQALVSFVCSKEHQIVDLVEANCVVHSSQDE